MVCFEKNCVGSLGFNIGGTSMYLGGSIVVEAAGAEISLLFCMLACDG